MVNKKEQKPPPWISIITAIVSLISALLVALIGFFGNARIADLKNQTTTAQLELQREMEGLNASLREAEITLEQQKFEAEQRSRRDQMLTTYIPQFLSDDQKESEVAQAVLFVLYPNEAVNILRVVANSISPEQSATNFERAVEQAMILDAQVGEWGIVVGNSPNLGGAQNKRRVMEEQGYSATVFRQENQYVTVVGPFSSQVEAESVTIAVRAIAQGAYVLNLNSWCPQPEQKTEGEVSYIECRTQPSRSSLRASGITYTLTEGETLLHVVQKTESVDEIASFYNVSADSIRKNNGLHDNTLYAGQVLIVRAQ